MENSKAWKDNNLLRESQGWKHYSFNNDSERWTYRVNEFINLIIHKYPKNYYKGWIGGHNTGMEKIAETEACDSFEECKEKLLDLVKIMCSGFEGV